MSLNEEVNERRKEIRTDGYAISIGEWLSLYENNEIDIHPEFQRIYRWSESQKTNLIESILLGIPVPPIFVSQRSDGIWDVVDGLQRLSTIYQFMGQLKDENNKPIPPLVLSGTKYLPSLEGKKWEGSADLGDEDPNSIGQNMRLTIKRSKLNVSIILKESDETAKYDLFQRLNTGGSSLSAQEVRNCILVMLNKDFYFWLAELSKFDKFLECIALSDRAISESYDIELVLRFIIFSLIDIKELDSMGDVGIFISEKMRVICTDKNFDSQYWGDLFRKTFTKLADNTADNSFKRYNLAKNKYSGGFLVSQYEAVTYGLAYNISEGTDNDNIDERISGLWSNQEFTNWSGSGITATRRLPHLIPLGREVFKK
ncbi:DUF262 domain-containing protein [Pantoea sp. XY16]|uniref:DUF262 domain-containing protein n=1 Tax=Pantoea sp. XY16 TaxID=2976705 RepID=UPI0021A39BF9|nr:DUF262 domain-containing protein [Pantoea sp. XY16]MCT2419514.1 DUF262 domain-containing protein [Pantoea sp. XY16]